MRLPIATLILTLFLPVWASAQHAPNATLSPSDLAEYSAQPARVRELIADALALTRRNLGYTFGSDDPARGGMDCSGTIYHLLRTHGWKDVPRDSSSQYEWIRAAGGYREVASKSADSAEFAGLRPGDLMFWNGTYATHRAGVGVSHVMLYLGTETKTRKRVMFGASDGRSYNGIQRFGVSVFDFKMPRPEQTRTDFLGYGRIPGLPSGTLVATAASIKPPPPEEGDEIPREEKKSDTPSLNSKAPKPKSGAAKPRTESEDPQPKKRASKSQGTKSAAEKSKAKPTEPPSEESEPASKSPKPKSAATKSKTESGDSQPTNSKPKTQKSDSETPKPKAGFQPPKSATSEPPSEDSRPKPKTKSQKAKIETDEAEPKVQKPKPPTSTPKPHAKSKTSTLKDDE